MKRHLLRQGFLLSLCPALLAGCATVVGDEQADENVGVLDDELCSAVTLVSNDTDYLAATGQSVTWTGSSTCTGTAQYRFVLRSPSGTWTVVRDWAASNTFVWNTTSLAAGNYTMQLWVRDANARPGKYDKYTSKVFSLSPSTPCSAVSTTVTPKTAATGTSVTFTSTAVGCPSPEYAIYEQAPGGSYQLVSAYSAANATYVWNTASSSAGTYNFQVWARGQGSPKTYEAYRTTSYTLLSTVPCSTPRLTFSPPTSSVAGTAVTLSASSSGCSSPTYRYLIQPPGGSYTVLQDWTTSNKANWNTTLAAPGQYAFQLWTRSAGSPVQYESYVTNYYTVTTSSTTSAIGLGGGYEHNCMVLSSGKAGCWGYNANGELGNGTTTTSRSPVAVSGITNAIAIGVGYAHNCAALSGGTVKCWGDNLHGQLGNGSTIDATTPVVVTGLSNASTVAAGTAHSCAVLADGRVSCWGYNSQGQLGDGSRTDRSTPVGVSGITDAVQATAGYYHTCALLRSGTVSCWGINTGGQLGNGTTTGSRTPVAVTGLTNVIAISANSGNNCAVRSDGTIWCWGSNSQYGTLGTGGTSPALVPTQVAGVANAKSVAVGVYHACAALQDGTARCWGLNSYGQLGNGTTTNSLSPVVVSSLSNVAAIGVANYSSCAALTDGTARCWGYNGTGALGTGAVANSSVPATVRPIP